MTAPSDLTALAAGSNKVSLSWTNVDIYDWIEVYRDGNPIYNLAGDAGTFDDISCQDGTGYTYKLVVSKNEVEADSNEATVITPLPTIWGLYGSATPTTARLQWNDISQNELGFKIYLYGVLLDTVGMNVNEYIAIGLDPGMWHEFYVTAYNALVESAPSNILMIFTDDPPAMPSNLTGNSTGTETAQINWKDNSSNESEFSIERSAVSASDGFAEIDTVLANITTFADSGLVSNTPYWYRVRSHNSSGYSAYSNVLAVVTWAAIAQPTGLVCIPVSDTVVDIYFNDNSELEDFHCVERKDSGAYAEIVQLEPNRNAYRDTGLTPDTVYTYKVRAKQGGASYSDYSSEVAVTTLDTPGTPTGLNVSEYQDTWARIAWTRAGGETGYKIETSLDDADWVEFGKIPDDISEFKITGLTASTLYYFRICAYNAAGDGSYTASVNQTTRASYLFSKFQRLIRKPSPNLVNLVEVNPMIELQGWAITDAQTYTYETTFDERGASLETVYENGIELTEKTSIATVEATAGTWWYDLNTKLIYVHPTGDDSPQGYVYTGAFWLNITNWQEKRDITKAGVQLQGATWTRGAGDWTDDYDSAASTILCIAEHEGVKYGGADDGNIYIEDGTGWALEYNSASAAIYCLLSEGGKLFAGAGGGSEADLIYVKTGANWTVSKALPLNGGGYCKSFCVFNDIIYAALYDGNYNTGSGIHIISSADLGGTWDISFSGTYAFLRPLGPQALATDGDNLYLAAHGGSTAGYIFKFDGVDWTKVFNGIGGYVYLHALFSWKGSIYAGGMSGKILASDDDGANWPEVKDFGAGIVRAFAEYGPQLLVAYDDVIYESADGAVYTEFYDSDEATIETLLVSGNYLYAGTGSTGKILLYTPLLWWSCAFVYGKVIDLQIDFVSLIEVTSLAACQATEGTWFYESDILYVHMIGDAFPGEFSTDPLIDYYVYDVVGFYLSTIDLGTVFNDNYYLSLVAANGIPDITQEIQPFYEGNFVITSGSVSFINALINGKHFFDQKYSRYLWLNRKVRIRAGGIGFTYAEFEITNTGIIDSKDITDQQFTLSLRDYRDGIHRTLPYDKYTLDEFINLDENAIDRVKPSGYGVITNAVPICTDTVNRIFEFHAGRIKSVEAVMQGETTLTVNVDYFIDYQRGRFILARDLAYTDDDIMLVNFIGAVDSADDPILGAAIFKHLLNNFLNVPDIDLDLDTIWATYLTQTATLALYLWKETDSQELIRRVEHSLKADTFQDAQGRLGIKTVLTSAPTDIIYIPEAFIFDLAKNKNKDSIFSEVNVFYGEDSSTDKFLSIKKTINAATWKHGVSKPLDVYTYLTTAANADALGTEIVALLNKDHVSFSVPRVLFCNMPGDLIYLTRKRYPSASGTATNKLLRILSISKQQSTGRTVITVEEV